jgi:hypothetical protein
VSIYIYIYMCTHTYDLPIGQAWHQFHCHLQSKDHVEFAHLVCVYIQKEISRFEDQ